RDKTVQTAGTVAYMAPELFRGVPASESSDLYSLGVVAQELMSNTRPYLKTTAQAVPNDAPTLQEFDDTSSESITSEILATDVELHMSGIDSVSPISTIIQKLLAKSPSERYADASTVIRDLSITIGAPLPPETAAARESFLQAASFVGRDQELNELTSALNASLHGTGSAWLIGGESGVGKSRLLEELRILALVKGVLVLRGQEIKEGAAPYQMWREAMRCLVFLTEVDSSEASVLRMLVPDIEALLG